MRTILNQDTISARRQASIATTFLVASALILPLAACDDTPAQPPQQPTEMTVQQDGRTSRLVQGRENCIAGLIEYGRTPNEAGDICDRAFADAMARRAANEHAPASSSGGGGGGSNALFWYLIGRDAGRSSVSVYEGSSSRGLSYLGGYGHTSPPPRSIASNALSTPARPPAAATTTPAPSTASKSATAPSSVARGGFAPGGGVGAHGG